MANCVTCKARCENAGQHKVEDDCISYDPKDYPKPQTNADRLRAMTDKELAIWIAGGVLNLTGGSLKMSAEAWLDWLRQEAEQ